MRWVARGAELLTKPYKRGVIAIVAIDVMQQSGQLGKRIGVNATSELLQTVASPPFEIFKSPSALGYGDHRDVQRPVPDGRLQGGEDLLVGEVA